MLLRGPVYDQLHAHIERSYYVETRGRTSQ